MSANLESLLAMPDHAQRAYQFAKRVEGLPERERVENIVVIGVGSAGIAGDVVVAAAGPYMAVPVTVVRSYEVPAFVGEGSLVFALSFSGDSEEVVEAASEAANRGARVVAVTCGGELGRRAGLWGAPCLRLARELSSGQAAMIAMAVSALSMLETIGLFPGASQWVEDAVTQLRERVTELSEPGNFAESIAEDMAGRTVMIHAAGALGCASALRWKTQLNAVAQVPAFWAAQPDVCFHEVAGWGARGFGSLQPLTDGLMSNCVLINLRHSEEHPQIAQRFEVCDRYLAPYVGAIVEVEAAGEGELAQVLDLMLIGDYVAMVAAKASGLTGEPAIVLSELRMALAER